VNYIVLPVLTADPVVFAAGGWFGGIIQTSLRNLTQWSYALISTMVWFAVSYLMLKFLERKNVDVIVNKPANGRK
jgi:hypothetical protein